MENEEVTSKALPAKEGFKFGCDPEFFIHDDKGRLVSAAGLIPGTKEDPYKVEDGAVQVDGMAAEFNIDPVDNFEDWNKRIMNVMRQLRGMLPKGYTPHIVPAVEFSEEVFNAAPSEAKELGCSPDFDAWTGLRNAPPYCDDRPFLRTASGHIHIGWRDTGGVDEPQHMMNCRDLVKQLDWYLGGWSLRVDKDPTRRLLYGKAGAFRPKPYGVEYRTLSNFWIYSKERRLVVWNRMQQAIADMRSRYMPGKMRPEYSKMLIEAINTSEVSKDLEAMARYPLVNITQASGVNSYWTATAGI
jgi:hypothetical protein